MSVRAAPLPRDALLQVYAADGEAYTDCFVCEVGRPVGLPDYLDAFYRSWAFLGEAVVLALALRQRVDPADAARLGRGETEAFAAWTVEARGEGQVLLCDITKRTRSWLAVRASGDGGTILYFGSAVVRPSRGWLWRGTAAFHVRYARLLLAASARRLRIA